MNRIVMGWIAAALLLAFATAGRAELTAGNTAAGTNVYPAGTGTLQRIGSLAPTAANDPIDCVAIDPSGSFAYLGSRNGEVVKIRLLDFTAAGAITLGQYITTAIIDPPGQYLYVTQGFMPTQLVKIRLSDFQVQGSLSFFGDPTRAVIDPTGTAAYFITPPADVTKINLTNFSVAWSRVGLMGQSINGFTIDPAGAFAYHGSENKVIKTRLSDFTEVGELTSALTGINFSKALIDPAGTNAWCIAGSKVSKIRLSDFTEVATATISDTCASAMIDIAGKYAYLGSTAATGKVIKLRLSDLAEEEAITLNSGEGRLYSAMIDPAGGYAYFGTTPAPSKLVKVALDRGIQNSIRATKIELPEAVEIKEIRFYTHQAGGNVRLAIFEDGASTKTLVWQSPALNLTTPNDWVSVPVTAGTPGILQLGQGTYWLAFNSDMATNFASYTAGNAGDGFKISWNYGNFPARLGNHQIISTADRWSQYLTYERTLPEAPSNPRADAATSTTITWAWTDNSALETGFKVWADAGGGTPGTLRTTTGINATSWTMSGLTPNTQYGFRVAATNASGDSSATIVATGWTLAGAPVAGVNIACDQTTGTNIAAGTPLVFSNPAGFSPGAHGGSPHQVSGFRYAFNDRSRYTFSGAEAVWDEGSLSQTPGQSGPYYLHLQSLNAAGQAGAATLAYGPFLCGLFAGQWTVGTNVYPAGEGNMRRIAGLPLPYGNEIYSAVYDNVRGCAYFGLNTGPGTIVKIRLSDFTPAGTLTLAAGENTPYSAVLDPKREFAYFGVSGTPGSIVKVRLSDFTRTGAVLLTTGETVLRCATMDPEGEYAYFGAGTTPGRIIKLRLSDFSVAGSLAGSPKTDNLQVALMDPAGTYAYFGSNAAPGIVTRIRLSDFTESNSLVSSGGDDRIHCGVIDPRGAFACFGTFNSPGFVFKVGLADPMTIVSRLWFGPNENWQLFSLIDPSGSFVYFGMQGAPGKLIKVRLSDFTRTESLTLPNGDDNMQSAVIDDTAGYAYIGARAAAGSHQSSIVKVALGPGSTIHATRISMPESGIINNLNLFSHQAGGTVRLALYDNGATTRTLLWQSPAIANNVTENWLSVPVSAGTPGELALPAGTYWLAFNTDSPYRFASYTPGNPGDGFKLDRPFGSFPGALAAATVQSVADRWSEYLTYELVKPAAPANPRMNTAGLDWITWGWTDTSDYETGFKLWANEGTDPPSTLKTTTAEGVTAWTMGELKSNTAYSFRVAATNNAGDSSATAPVTAWTLIEPAAGLELSAAGPSSIDARITNAPSNLAQGGSGLALANLTAETESGWQQTTSTWRSMGLTPNTPYTFSARTRNGAGVETTAVTAVKHTGAGAPAPGINVLCDKSAGAWYAPGTAFVFSNPKGFGTSSHGGDQYKVSGFQTAWTMGEIYEFNGSPAEWKTGTLTRTAGTGSACYLHLRSVNAGGEVNPDARMMGPFRIDHQAPAKPAAPAAVSAVTTGTNAVTFVWTAATDAESGVAAYECQAGTAPGASNIFSGNVGNATSKTVAGPLGATLYCRVRAIDSVGNIGPWSDASSSVFIDTPPTTPTLAITPAPPRTLDEITAFADAFDTDPGDTVTAYRYEWRRGVEVQSTSSTLRSELTAKGQRWTLVAWARDSHGAWSPPGILNFTIANTPPTQPIVELRPKPAQAGQDLIVDVQVYSTDPDGDQVAYDFQWFKSVDGGANWIRKVELDGSPQVSGQYIFDGELWEVRYIPYEKGAAAKPEKIAKPAAAPRIEGRYGWDRAYIGTNHPPKLSLDGAYAQRQAGGTLLGVGWNYHDADGQACTVDLEWTNPALGSYQALAKGLPAKQGNYRVTGAFPLDKPMTIHGVIRDAKGAVSQVLSAPVRALPPATRLVVDAVLGKTAIVNSGDLDVNGDGRVDVVDVVRGVAGTPPEVPAPLAPADGAQGVGASTVLDWNGGLHTQSYEVYLWEADTARPPTPTASGLTGSAMNVPGSLKAGTKYWWQVVALGGGTRTCGPIRSFTTKP